MPVYSRDAGPTGKFFVDFDFILKIGTIDPYVLEFQSEFLSSLEVVPYSAGKSPPTILEHILTLIHNTEGSAT